MLTNPNTLGLFDTNIERDRGDRPRRRGDALLRRREPQRGHGPHAPGRHGLRHRPLQPAQDVHAAARGRRPGRRPDRRLGPHRALPAAARRSSAARARATTRSSTSTSTARSSIGRLRGFQGNYGVFVRSYAYILSLGADGLREASEIAVLNANYLLARLREHEVGELLPVAFDRELHARVRPLRRPDEARAAASARSTSPSGCSTTASTRRPSTSRCSSTRRCWSSPPRPRPSETLDAFADVGGGDPARGGRRPEIARNAPYTTPVRRLDEAGAAKRPVVRQPL